MTLEIAPQEPVPEADPGGNRNGGGLRSGGRSPGGGDFLNRVLFTLGALVVFRIGTYVPVPGINAENLADILGNWPGGVIEIFDGFAGGGLRRMSIFALGIFPYIAATMIFSV